MTIGRGRKISLYRLLGAGYMVVVGLWLTGVFGLLGIIFAGLDLASGILFNRPMRFGRTWSSMGFNHHLAMLKWILFGTEFPGWLPSKQHASRV